MMKVEMFSQYVANTISFEGDDALYLRLTAEKQVVWYKTDGQGAFQWVLHHKELEKAWIGRYRS
jgi:hypothetical protein